LIFIEKVEAGLKQLEEGKTISHENVKEIVKKW
jgi:predicted transcriptional regulator